MIKVGLFCRKGLSPQGELYVQLAARQALKEVPVEIRDHNGRRSPSAAGSEQEKFSE